MNGKIAKRLRKIVKALELAPKTTYGVVGAKRQIKLDDGTLFDKPLTVVMEACQRKAYKTAKRLYVRG